MLTDIYPSSGLPRRDHPQVLLSSLAHRSEGFDNLEYFVNGKRALCV